MSIKSKLTLFFCALGLLAINLWVLGPFLTHRAGVLWTQGIYFASRLTVLMVYGFLARLWLKQPRTHVLRVGSLLVFLDQVVFKWLHLQGMDLGSSNSSYLFPLMMSYVIFLPVMLLISVAGWESVELYTFFRSKNLKKGVRGAHEHSLKNK